MRGSFEGDTIHVPLTTVQYPFPSEAVDLLVNLPKEVDSNSPVMSSHNLFDFSLKCRIRFSGRLRTISIATITTVSMGLTIRVVPPSSSFRFGSTRFGNDHLLGANAHYRFIHEENKCNRGKRKQRKWSTVRSFLKTRFTWTINNHVEGIHVYVFDYFLPLAVAWVASPSV